MVNPQKIFGRLGNQMFQGAYIYAQMKRGMIPDIYVQDPAYFDEYRNDIRVLYGDKIGHINKIAIHVRRGANPVNPTEPKYCDNTFYVNLFNTDYYRKAMGMFPGEDFMVFSDDIEWCKKQDIFKNCSFSEGHDEIQDLNIMASCKGIIMANSSFSWWAAYLSKAKVITPKAWYKDGVERTKCPEEWIRL